MPPLKISESGEFDDLVSGPTKPKALGIEKRKLQGLIPDRTLLDHAYPGRSHLKPFPHTQQT